MAYTTVRKCSGGSYGKRDDGTIPRVAVADPVTAGGPAYRAECRAWACARGRPRVGLAGLADTAELLVSELVTNAVRASAKLRTAGSPVVHLWVTSDRVCMVVHVWDASGEMPERRDADEHDEDGGRGLLLVETLGKDWGAYRTEEGKVVWCLITAEP